MAKILAERMTVVVPQEAVLFLIGVRINTPWKIHKWLPVFRAMPKMLKELEEHPELGLLHYRQHFSLRSPWLVQYWESMDKLMEYARARDSAHLPAWRDFNRAMDRSEAVGIWHETYRITPGNYEAVYNNMPEHGLAKAIGLVPATGARESAPQRLGDANSAPAVSVDGAVADG